MRWVSLLVAVSAVLSACSPKPALTTASLDGYGLFELKVSGAFPSGRSSSGQVNLADSHKLTRTTDVIEAKPGVTFGIAYTPVGPARYVPIETTVKISHPPITNPATGRTLTYDTDLHQDSTGLPTFTAFTFDNPWELVPGQWTFQVYEGSHLLVEKTFAVVTGK